MDTHQGVYNVILCSSDGSIQEILLGFGFELKIELSLHSFTTLGFDSFFEEIFFLLCFQCWNFCFGKEMDLDLRRFN